MSYSGEVDRGSATEGCDSALRTRGRYAYSQLLDVRSLLIGSELVLRIVSTLKFLLDPSVASAIFFFSCKR